MLFLPLLVVNSEAFLPIHVPANGLAYLWCIGILLSPGLELGIALVRIDLDVLVGGQGVQGGSGTKGDGASHDNNDGIGGWIREPGGLDTVLFQWLRKREGQIGESRSCSEIHGMKFFERDDAFILSAVE